METVTAERQRARRTARWLLAGLLITLVVVIVGQDAIAEWSNDTPEPLGDGHVIDVARQFDVNSHFTDEEILEFNSDVQCTLVDRDGKSGFDSTAKSIVALHHKLDRVEASLTMIGAVVRAYCPEHVPAMQEWASGVADMDDPELLVYPCERTVTGRCWMGLGYHRDDLNEHDRAVLTAIRRLR